MVTMVALGTFLLAAGPCLALLFVVLVPNPHLVVIATIAAFMWSLALSISGAVYWMIPPLRTTYPWLLFVTVAVQEVMRLALFEVFRFMFKSGDGVQAFLRTGAKNTALTGISVGTGFGLLSVLINFYSAVIDEFKDDTAIYTDKCSLNFFVAASLYAMAFSVLHVVLGALVWPAYTEREWVYIFAGFAIHLGISEITLVNRRDGSCQWAIGLVFGLVLFVMCTTGLLVRMRVCKEAA